VLGSTSSEEVGRTWAHAETIWRKYATPTSIARVYETTEQVDDFEKMIKTFMINIWHYMIDCLTGVPMKMFDVDSLSGIGRF
jgi:hypothetical protein